MFLITTIINGKTHNITMSNKKEDDFIKYLPRNLSFLYEQEITKDQIIVSRLPDYSKRKVEAVNDLDIEVSYGKAKFKKKIGPKFKLGDKPTKQKYESLASEFAKDAKQKPEFKKNLKTKKETRGEGENAHEVELVELEADDVLVTGFESVELEIDAIPLKRQWPYDAKGRFLGNE